MSVRPIADPVRLMVKVDQVADAVELPHEVNLSVAGIDLDKKGT